jgi:hypothetical protein
MAYKHLLFYFSLVYKNNYCILTGQKDEIVQFQIEIGEC